MIRSVLVLLLAIVSFAPPGGAPTRDQLIGTWKLVSAKITTDNGEVRDSWGPNPAGFLTYTADGRVSAILSLQATARLFRCRISSRPPPKKERRRSPQCPRMPENST